MASDGVLIYDSADKTPPKPQASRVPQCAAFDPRPFLAVLSAGVALALIVRNYRAERGTKEIAPTLSGMPMTLEALTEMGSGALWEDVVD